MERTIHPQELQSKPQLRGYDVDLDIADFKFSREDKHILFKRKQHDLETMLGERFDVEISQISYSIENGKLHSPEFQEPFSERIQMGIDYRKARHSPDLLREQAELVGFLKLEQGLETAPLGTKFVVISPPGIEYPKKFFDIYQKTDQGAVAMSRYTSSQDAENLYQIAQNLDINWHTMALANPNAAPTDADFLANPLRTALDIKTILEEFHPETGTLPLGEYNKLKIAAAPLREAYLNQLKTDPTPSKVYPLYNALLNFADDFVLNPQNRQKLQSNLRENSQTFISELAIIPVRPVMAGCGLQGGYETTSGSAPYSAADYARTSKGEDQFGTLEIHCGECGANYNRSPGKLEEKCRRCGGTKGIAC